MTLVRTVLAAGLIALTLPGAALAAELPAEAHIVYDVLYGDGGLRIGRAEQQWRLAAGRYRLSTELVPLLGPRIRYLSTGRVGEAGLVPESFAEYRGDAGQPRVHADFDWAAMTVHYGAGQEARSAPLERGAQDVNALAFQLTWLGERAAGSLQVATGKKVSRRSFSGAARAQVTVNGQPVEAVPWRSGSTDDRTEVWVAPRLGNLPVRVVRVDDGKELRLVARELQFTPAP